MFYKTGILKTFVKFTRKHDVGLQTSNFIKKKLQIRCSLVNFAKFLRTFV